MSRPAPTKTKTIIIVVVFLLVALGGGAWAYVANSPSHKTHVVTNAQHQITQLSYQGQNGVNALDLLKKHAAVKTKHYSFGDMVTSINGTAASGGKFWAFYVNGKMASSGASSYATKNSDTLMWKLQ